MRKKKNWFYLFCFQFFIFYFSLFPALSYMRMKSARAELLQLQIVRTKRKNIGVEMLKTEETYVKTLDILVNKIRVSMSTQRFDNFFPS